MVLLLFPLQFLVGLGDVSAIVIVEERPAAALGRRRRRRRLADRPARGDRGAHVVAQASSGSGAATAMAGAGSTSAGPWPGTARRAPRASRASSSAEPAEQAAVERGDAADEEQVGREQQPRVGIEHREVGSWCAPSDARGAAAGGRRGRSSRPRRRRCGSACTTGPAFSGPTSSARRVAVELAARRQRRRRARRGRRTPGASSRKAPAPKAWSGWTWLMTTWRIGRSVRARISARSQAPSARLPPGSVTSTASRPITKPMLAMPPSVGRGRLGVGPAADEDAGRDLLDAAAPRGEAGQAAEAGRAEQGAAPRRRERRRLRHHGLPQPPGEPLQRQFPPPAGGGQLGGWYDCPLPRSSATAKPARCDRDGCGGRWTNATDVALVRAAGPRLDRRHAAGRRRGRRHGAAPRADRRGLDAGGDRKPPGRRSAAAPTASPSGLAWEVVESLPVSEDIKKQTGDWRGASRRPTAPACATSPPPGSRSSATTSCRCSTGPAPTSPGGCAHGGTCMRFDFADFAAFDLHILARPGAATTIPTACATRRRRRFAAMDDDARGSSSPRNVAFGLPGAAEQHDARRPAGAPRRVRRDLGRAAAQHFIDFLEEVVPDRRGARHPACAATRTIRRSRCSACRGSCRPRPTMPRSWRRSTARRTASPSARARSAPGPTTTCRR